ncbi:unnamed protein product [Ambrosiozyma monospora]|uniref:Unnamed protein product n=1 Tax=Ambrosiozyma monospora TaxID=43982 RepID=A0ACB5TTY1_AMBMO|nr:unnamed protein product [Ambrosiozyma monospora]
MSSSSEPFKTTFHINHLNKQHYFTPDFNVVSGTVLAKFQVSLDNVQCIKVGLRAIGTIRRPKRTISIFGGAGMTGKKTFVDEFIIFNKSTKIISKSKDNEKKLDYYKAEKKRAKRGTLAIKYRSNQRCFFIP